MSISSNEYEVKRLKRRTKHNAGKKVLVESTLLDGIWYFPNMFPNIKLQYDNSVKKILIYVTSSALAVISSKGTSDEGLHGLQGLLIKRYCIGK